MSKSNGNVCCVLGDRCLNLHLFTLQLVCQVDQRVLIRCASDNACSAIRLSIAGLFDGVIIGGNPVYTSTRPRALAHRMVIIVHPFCRWRKLGTVIEDVDPLVDLQDGFSPSYSQACIEVDRPGQHYRSRISLQDFSRDGDERLASHLQLTSYLLPMSVSRLWRTCTITNRNGRHDQQ